MHIAALYQYGHNPDCSASARLWHLMDEWRRGHEVTLLTSDAWRGKRGAFRHPWVPPGVRLVEVPLRYDNAMTTPQRVVAYGQFMRRVLGVAAPAPDVLMASSTPLSAAWAGARLARRWGVPWVFEVRDLWPEFPIQAGAVPRPLHAPLRRLERGLYASAARIVTLSPDMSAHVGALGFGAKTTTSYGGSETDPHAVAGGPRRASSGRTRTLLYAGTLGRANAIPLVLAAAERMAGRGDHEFVFMGDGYHAPDVRAAAAWLPNVRFAGEVPRAQMARWFQTADLSLVTFRPLPVLAANSPSKLYDSLASGTPVVVTNGGWTRALAERSGAGWYCPSDDADAFARHLCGLLDAPDALAQAAKSARAFACDPGNALLFDRDAQARQYEHVFRSAVDAGSAAQRSERTTRALVAA